MRTYHDRAIVLRQHKLGEADRILTLLTLEHGLVRAVAQGVRRTRSKFGARLELFAHVEVGLHAGRSLDTVTHVQTLHAYADSIALHYPRYTIACSIVETAERLAGEERAPAPALHLVTVGALGSLARGEYTPELILDAYFLRAMSCSGWTPALRHCARCGALGPHHYFHIASGGSLCEICRTPGAVHMSEAMLTHLLALMEGSWGQAVRCDSATAKQMSGLISAQLQWHLEYQLKSLPLVDRTTVPAVQISTTRVKNVQNTQQLRSTEEEKIQ